MSLYERFCQLDRSAKGFISEDEFLSIPEFSLNPLSKVRSTSLIGRVWFPSSRILVKENLVCIDPVK